MINPFVEIKKLHEQNTQLQKNITELQNFQKEITDYELSYTKSNLLDGINFTPYNPHDLVRKKGFDIFDKMLQDEQVRACLFLKKMAVISPGWEVKGRDKKRVDFIRYALKRMGGTFENTLFYILSALDYGYSVTEKIYQIFEDGEWEGKIGIKALKTRPPKTFDFDIDEHGNLKPEGLLQSVFGFQDTKLSPDKFIIYTYDSLRRNFYGNSDLISAYRPYWSKDVIMKMWLIHLEKFGIPTAWGQYPRNLSNDKQSELLTMIDGIKNRNAMITPEDCKIQFLEATQRGQNTYQEAMRTCNIMIARAILIPNLLGYSEYNEGSYALGEKQFDVFVWLLEWLKKDVSETINERLIKDLIDYNFPHGGEYPEFYIKLHDKIYKEKLAVTWTQAVATGAAKWDVESENYLRELMEFPKRDESDIEPPIPPTQTKQFKKAVKVDFKKIENLMNDKQDEYEQEISDILSRSLDTMIFDVQKIVENGYARKDIEGLNLRGVKDLGITFDKLLMDAYVAGKDNAKEEVFLSKNFQIEISKIKSVLPPKNALKSLKDRKFKITGDLKDAILKKVKNELYGSMQSGKPTPEIIQRVKNIFSEFMEKGEMIDGAINMAGRIETIIRTNFSNAYNQGRLEMFRSPELSDYVEAYQFSATLDERTTRECELLDGEIFLSTDEAVNRLTPPLHFNCRSILIPVTRGEEYEAITGETKGKAMDMISPEFGGDNN